jgi:hypothetical protein
MREHKPWKDGYAASGSCSALPGGSFIVPAVAILPNAVFASIGT